MGPGLSLCSKQIHQTWTQYETSKRFKKVIGREGLVGDQSHTFLEWMTPGLLPTSHILAPQLLPGPGLQDVTALLEKISVSALHTPGPSPRDGFGELVNHKQVEPSMPWKKNARLFVVLETGIYNIYIYVCDTCALLGFAGYSWRAILKGSCDE